MTQFYILWSSKTEKTRHEETTHIHTRHSVSKQRQNRVWWHLSSPLHQVINIFISTGVVLHTTSCETSDNNKQQNPAEQNKTCSNMRKRSFSPSILQVEYREGVFNRSLLTPPQTPGGKGAVCSYLNHTRPQSTEETTWITWLLSQTLFLLTQQ